jgi:hypothetical protein
LRLAVDSGEMTATTNPDLTLSAEPGALMSAEQAALLKRLSHDAYDFQAFAPHLSQAEAARRIAGLRAKLQLQSEPPHTQ